MDTSMLAFLAAPFVASLILTGIHSYLGVHVVERGVIFVDLSLAQIAALGATIAILLPISGGDPHAAILAMSKATSESEHLKDMLVGNILAVSWPEVAKTALLYGAVGTFHYVFRRKFLAISMDPRGAEAEGIS